VNPKQSDTPVKKKGEIMAVPCCHNCVYSVCDPELWLRLMWAGEPIVPRCANHPNWPGQLHDVPGVPCPNYRPKPVLPQGDSVRLIPLGEGTYTYVDAGDYEELSRYTWRLENGYASRYENGKRIFMHRQIMRPPDDMVVDHIDASRANNCRCNLRVCTHAENQRNQRKRRDSHSRFKGVFLNKRRRKWYAVCRGAGKGHWRGYFDDEVEAARAYDRMAVELFPEFARVNFPKEWPPERRAEVHALFQAQHRGPESEKKKAEGRNKKSRTKPQSRRVSKRQTPATRRKTLTRPPARKFRQNNQSQIIHHQSKEASPPGRQR
jgi:hypothetical protein